MTIRTSLRVYRGLRWLAAALAVVAAFSSAIRSRVDASEWKLPEIKLPSPLKHPIIACTDDELQRLRSAWKNGSKNEKAVVDEMIRDADRALARPLEFPPRGGQHNQWYQCEKCQLALRTVDDTHHRCPKCATVYTGEPYDDVIFARDHSRILSGMESAAWAWAVTQDRKYAEFAARALLGYSQRYREYPYHTADRSAKPGRTGGHLAEQTLNESSILGGQIAPAYDLICDSGVLSAADQEAIRSGLLIPMIENIDKNKAGKSNWQSYHNAAMLAGGVMLGDVGWVRKAIADPKNGFLFQMGESVTTDGMWYENSWGYHSYTLGAMVMLAEPARRLGIDLYGQPSLKKMFLIPVQYGMPDGSLPRFGDDTHSTVSGAAGHLEFAWNAYHDSAMLPYLSSRPTWNAIMLGREVGRPPAAPQLESTVFPAAGHAILRSKGGAGLVSAITFGPYGGFHGHFDKLSFVFFGRGTELGVDPGRARSQAYRLPIHSRWYKATLSHNTILVDRKSQSPAAGRLECFAANDQYAAVVVLCTEAYPKVQHRRALCQTPDYLIVLDDLTGTGEHTYDWVYHNRGKTVECEAAGATAEADKSLAGSEFLENIWTGTTSDDVHVRFTGGEVSTHVLLDGAAGTGMLTADGPEGSVVDRAPMMMATRRGASARFAAVLEPVADGQSPLISRLECSDEQGSIRIVVTRGQSSDLLEIGSDGSLSLAVDQKTVLVGRRQ
jgi:hypothetical protein